MPLEELMSWSLKQKRWYKRYRGKLYWVGPKTLKCEATKEASRKAANDWWTAKQADIDEKLGEAKKHPDYIVNAYTMAIGNHLNYAKWHRRHEDEYEDADIAEAERSEAIAENLTEALKTDNPPYPLTEDQFDPIYRFRGLGSKWGAWIQRLQAQNRELRAETAVPKENTIRAHVDDYLALVKAHAQAKGKLGKYSDASYRLGIFRKWVDPTAPIENLNEAIWERFNIWLVKQVADGQLAPATGKGVQVATRAFIRNRWERRFIELPRNLNNRVLSVSVPTPVIRVFSVGEVKQLVKAATERTRLFLLLSLNCGMYPSDIAMLRQDEVDWKAGRIARKRTKTRDRSGNVPKVDYLLWRSTFRLLKKHRSEHPELVLLNRKGLPLWAEHEVAGKFNRKSNFRSAWIELLKKLEWKKEDNKPPMKCLRKTSATMLENHPEYGRYAEYFLGEAPHSIATRHYIQPSREQFDAAIKWLGQQFGIAK